MRRIVLASKSPRRKVLLSTMATFTVAPVDVQEVAPRALPVPLAVQAIARKKAIAASVRDPDAFVLAADTVVERDGRLIGKAKDELQARMTLADLSGNEHRVTTGLALAWNEELLDDDVATTRLHMERLPGALVDAYVKSGEWQGKAGGYGIQDAAMAPHVRILEGPWTNVVGLPLQTTYGLLQRNDIPCNEPPSEDAARRLF